MHNRLTTLMLAAAAALALPGMAQAANVGYYEMCDGTGDAIAAAAITTAGDTPVNVNVPDAVTLASLDALFVTNCSNDDYGSEYLANVAAINNAVQTQGLVLIVHDRYVTGASTILPGVIGVRDLDNNDADIDFPLGSPILTGPGGTLNNTSLDGGDSSSHGYVTAASLPAGGQILAHRPSASQGVTVTYPWGSGRVVYSTIPLDYYFDGADPVAFKTIYAPNIIAWAVSGSTFTTCAAAGYFGAKRILCHQICEVPQSRSRLYGLLRVYRALYRETPACAL